MAANRYQYDWRINDFDVGHVGSCTGYVFSAERQKGEESMNPVRPGWRYVYALKCNRTGTFYIGVTKNLETGMGKRYIKNRIKGGLTG